ncbi:succinoglycan biosynthesis protein ExoM [Phyllobacterium ifriqiyense]|uniref:Succinoglycan biosynthesis protein ExoM n=1 Tax=Phyllobacterium ifriqiyense TaxID=314238 RepID=A0ABU0S3Q7_9HYPH|nr:glycosyltransferase family 2 protein [Phyllobacterium ifriqiyense]MDQ0995400.1 succinoglycan biosynthesis protein ExoM [Phyllobacterium ifriqiyense]
MNNERALLDRRVKVTVCICTYRRPQIAATLRSVDASTGIEDYQVDILVADNDLKPTARELVSSLANQLSMRVRYIHAPSSNISLARNACLEAAAGDYVAFIDDDETASSTWLSHLLRKACLANSDVVLGPVKAIYGIHAPGWMVRGKFHDTLPVWVKNEIRAGYTCNALIRLGSPAIIGRRFDPALGRTGGEDTVYFHGVWKMGGKIDYAPDAWVEESVPGNRASFKWLRERRFRFGQTHAILANERKGKVGLAGHMVLAGAKAGYSFMVALVVWFLPVRRNRWLLRGIMHAGVVSRLAGMRTIEAYGVAGKGDQRNAS